MAGIVTIYKSFNECVGEILNSERATKEIPPRLPTAEVGKPIEIFTRGYGETLAEIRKLILIKRMCEKKGIK